MEELFERTKNRFKRHQPTICVDMDGVIASRDNLNRTKIGEPLEGSDVFLEELHNLGWKIIIFSCRPKKMLEGYLAKYDLYYDEINENSSLEYRSPKPVADVYLDDRGITFEGDYEETLKRIIDFTPWWED